MKRRLLTILLPLAVASLTAGCTTFSDNDAAARVDTEELTPELLGELSEFIAVVGGLAASPTDAQQARDAANLWIQTEALERYFAAQNLDVPEATIDGASNDFDQILINIGDADGPSNEARAVIVDFLAFYDYLPQLEGSGTLVQDALNLVDIYVDPRLGTFNSGIGIVPLG